MSTDVLAVIREAAVDEHGLRNIDIDLPVSWARECHDVSVRLLQRGPLGWGAAMIGDGQVILTFPWHDDVDDLLRHAPQEFPTAMSDLPWVKADQGWWAGVQRYGDDVYLAETDYDELLDLRPFPPAVCRTPGVVLFGDVQMRWSRVTVRAYTRAWADAVAWAHSERERQAP